MTRTAPITAKANGTTVPAATEDVRFPVDSFRDAAPHLRRPFTSAAVKFKVQATWPKDNPTGGLIVAYIDARLAVERLNLIVPHLWFDEYEPLGSKHLVCRLTVDGITRQDVGEGTGKGLYSDALKRAAVKFGVGVSLYAIPQARLDKQSGALKDRRTRDGMTLELTPKGEQIVRAGYTAWLEAHGIKAFGQPLDHGDVEGAQGDHEADGEVPPGVDPQTGEIVEPAAPRIGPDTATELQGLARAAIDSGAIDGPRFKLQLVDLGALTTANLHDGIASLPVDAEQPLRDLLMAATTPEPESAPEPEVAA